MAVANAGRAAAEIFVSSEVSVPVELFVSVFCVLNSWLYADWSG